MAALKELLVLVLFIEESELRRELQADYVGLVLVELGVRILAHPQVHCEIPILQTGVQVL